MKFLNRVLAAVLSLGLMSPAPVYAQNIFSCNEVSALLNAKCKSADDSAYTKYNVKSYKSFDPFLKLVFARRAVMCYDSGQLCNRATPIILQEIIPLANASLPPSETMRIHGIDEKSRRFSYDDKIRAAVVSSASASVLEDIINQVPSRAKSQYQLKQTHQSTQMVREFILGLEISSVMTLMQKIDERASLIPDYMLYSAAYAFAAKLQNTPEKGEIPVFKNSRFNQIFKQAQEVVAGKIDIRTVDAPDDAVIVKFDPASDGSKVKVSITGVQTAALVAPEAVAKMVPFALGLYASAWLFSKAVIAQEELFRTLIQDSSFQMTATESEIFSMINTLSSQEYKNAYSAAQAYVGTDELYDEVFNDLTKSAYIETQAGIEQQKDTLLKLSSLGAALAQYISSVSSKTMEATRTKQLPSTCQYNGNITNTPVYLSDLWTSKTNDWNGTGLLNLDDGYTSVISDILLISLKKHGLCSVNKTWDKNKQGKVKVDETTGKQKKGDDKIVCLHRTLMQSAWLLKNNGAVFAADQLNKLDNVLKYRHAFNDMSLRSPLVTRFVYRKKWYPYPEVPLLFNNLSEIGRFFKQLPLNLLNDDIKILQSSYIIPDILSMVGAGCFRFGPHETQDKLLDALKNKADQNLKYRHLHYEERKALDPGAYICNHALYFPLISQM